MQSYHDVERNNYQLKRKQKLILGLITKETKAKMDFLQVMLLNNAKVSIKQV